MVMLGTLALCLYLTVSPGLSFPERDIPNVEPDYLDSLLENKEYELFSKIMKIDVSLVRPREEKRTLNPMFHKELKFGDIILTEEQARQGMRFNRFPERKWKNGKVPYAISAKYTESQRSIIEKAINRWNLQVDCIGFFPRQSEKDYVFIYSGEGCFSNGGRTGGSQPLSIDINGCVDEATILHEMEHAIGIAHEQNRSDRDDYIEMIWDNIPEEWKGQFVKTSNEEYTILGRYDYYSLMHYEVNAPGTDKPAFKVLEDFIDESKIGRADGFTSTDLDKIANLYCDKK